MKPIFRISSLVLLVALLMPEWTGTRAYAIPRDSNSSSAAVSQSSAPTNQAASERKTPWYKSRTAKSAGVGGAGGALFGALVGGGKGAAIGAISGGAGGYLYDRFRKKK